MSTLAKHIHRVLMAFVIAGSVCVESASGSLMSASELDQPVPTARSKTPDRSDLPPCMPEISRLEKGSMDAAEISPVGPGGSGSMAIFESIGHLPVYKLSRRLSVCDWRFIPDPPCDCCGKPPKNIESVFV